jgi:hypothetical protein
MSKRVRTKKRNKRAAEADQSRVRVDGANMIGRHKSKVELDAEAEAAIRAEALLKKAQSQFYSLE